MKLFLIFFILSSSLFSAEICTKDLQSYPTLSGGRVKPLMVLAQETIKFIYGEKKINKEDPTIVFCRLSLKSFGLPTDLTQHIRVEHIKTKELLKLKENSTHISFQDLKINQEILLNEVRSLTLNDSYKKDLTRTLNRLKAAESLEQGTMWTIPVVTNNNLHWISLGEFLTDEHMLPFKDLENPILSALKNQEELYLSFGNDTHLLELNYFKFDPFFWAMLTSLLALLLWIPLKSKSLPMGMTILTLLIQITGVTMRVLISGRAPITNMYETVMFSGFGALLIALVIFSYRKEKIFVIAGLAYNILCLLMMKFANQMLDAGISPLVPVLRDNFWLSTHVTTVILSYAALALSWLLANILLIKSSFSNMALKDYRYQVDLIYTCIKYGIIALAAGVILGGVWADYSWGRFWGWDPKETWSLIVLLCYMIILHGKYSSWINDTRFVYLVAGAFMSVMMAWFGVNYILATGLHSYGFSEGGAIFLGSFFLIQILILLLAYLKRPATKL